LLIHPDIDPVAIAIGPLKIHWYGLMYLVGFLGGYAFGVWRARQPDSGWDPGEIGDLLFHIAVGVIIGGRLGYALFYNAGHYLSAPHEILYLWSGGMSFHGGMIGVIVALWWYARRTRRPLLAVTDYVAVLAPIGLGPGRIGNFINQELWGKPSDLPWAMVFPRADDIPRHPSMLYEAVLEGPALFFLLLWFANRRPETGRISGLFLAAYAAMRFAVEFVRLPDAHIGYLAWNWLTMGQLLSLPMLALGLWLMLRRPANVRA
jgi:phosphatidylglycerol:prolipoprotein diacylglycerol transferase